MGQTTKHNSTSLAKFILRNEGHSCTKITLLGFFISSLLSFSSFAQDSSNHQISVSPNQQINPLTQRQKNRRVAIISAANIAGYGGSLIAFNKAWYKNYPRQSFHTFNDIKEWQQVDKVGHAWAAYNTGKVSTAMWRWAGLSQKKSALIGGLSGAAYLTVIEFLDAHSSQWGWSWGDIGANFFGSGLFIGQELLWKEQRIQYKFSFHRKSYPEPMLANRANNLYGKTWYERMLKDYNGQTYWLSFNMRSFLPKSKMPRWLNISVGYGAEGMLGGFNNTWIDANGITINRPDIKRYSQWYLAPDIDFTKIRTNKKGVKVLLAFLNAFKFPMPALEFSNGKFRFNAISY